MQNEKIIKIMNFENSLNKIKIMKIKSYEKK